MAQGIVTVFGGTGFLGRIVVRRLADAGYRVRVASRRPRTAGNPTGAGGVEFRHVDLRDDAAVAEALQGADAAVNAVSLYVERRGLRFDDIHVHGAERVAHLAGRAGATTVVHISGIGADKASASAYVRARARGEQAVRAASPAAVILRPSVLFGAGGAFLSAIEAITKLPVIPLFGDGRMKLQPVHVEDVAAAVERALELPSAAGSVFELGGAHVYRYREIVQAMLAHTGRRRRLLLPVPFPVWRLLAGTASILPNPPLTSNQVVLMQSDNIVGRGVGRFTELNIEPRGLKSALPGVSWSAG